MNRWFEGKEDAPEGVIPEVGHSGPGVKVQARDDAHVERIKATGYYKASTAPVEPESDAVADAAPALPTPPTDPAPDTTKKAGK